MNASLDTNFKIALPWKEVDGVKISGHNLQLYYEYKGIRAYHCRNCGAPLKWVQAAKSHYPCWSCKYDGDYKNQNPRAEYEI